MSKHTPGPWQRVLDHHGGLIVDVDCKLIGEFRKSADANLAAATPDLLYACQYAYAMLHQHPDDQFAQLVNELRKVIEKATPTK